MRNLLTSIRLTSIRLTSIRLTSIRWLIVIGCLAALTTAACGDDVPPEPQMTGLELSCVDSGESGVDGQVLETLSVQVTDADRDLVSVKGTLNGVQITLADDDADERFTWSPASGDQPIACRGDLTVSLTAVDKAGHETTLFQIVQK